MHAISTLRYDAANGKEASYYRLKESYRDVHGHVHSLILLNIGFEPSLTPRQVHRIANYLSDRFENRDNPSLFGSRTDCLADIEHAWAEKFWRRMIDEGHIDRFNRKEDKAREEAQQYVDLNTVEHTDARNVGAEWLCKQTYRPSRHRKEPHRAVRPDQLLLRGSQGEKAQGCLRTKQRKAQRLPPARSGSMHQRRRLHPLFVHTRGQCRRPCLTARHGAHTLRQERQRRTLVVMYAGIATNDNLRMLRQMGYDYLCVTRNKIKDYTISPDHTTVDVTDSRSRRITLLTSSLFLLSDSWVLIISQIRKFPGGAGWRKGRDGSFATCTCAKRRTGRAAPVWLW